MLQKCVDLKYIRSVFISLSSLVGSLKHAFHLSAAAIATAAATPSQNSREPHLHHHPSQPEEKGICDRHAPEEGVAGEGTRPAAWGWD